MASLMWDLERVKLRFAQQPDAPDPGELSPEDMLAAEALATRAEDDLLAILDQEARCKPKKKKRRRRKRKANP